MRVIEHYSELELDEMLDSRQQKVLRLRSGIEDGHRHTFVEIGTELGIGPTRVRQIQNASLHRLRQAKERHHD